MDTNRICPGCQKLLTPNAPQGLCPECLIKAGLGTGVDIRPDSRAEGGQTRFVAPTLDELGKPFPQLEILSFIGQGGMGAVYKARQKALDRIVALKILPPGIGNDPAFAERFTREAKALAALNHPNIVTIHDFGQTGGFYYLLMEFVDGVNLRQAMKAARFTPEQALAIVPPVCEALQYAHEHGIVHRDIKPENLLLDKEGRVKIADFGVAKMLNAGEAPEAGPTESQPAGTPQYMAPEQQAHRRTDHRADIYSLGVVLYELLTGELPGKPLEAPSKKVVIDVRLDEIVLRALENKPELRYQTAGEMRTQVETIASTPSASSSRREEAQAEKSEMPPRFSRTAIVGACWAALSHIVFVGLGLTAPGTTAPGLTTSFGTTILGWIAVRQIRRSAGKLRGLGLAVFEGLLFPLVALDGVISAAVVGGLAAMGMRPGVNMEKSGMVLVGGLMLVVSLVVDFLIIRAVWRAVNKPSTSCRGVHPG